MRWERILLPKTIKSNSFQSVLLITGINSNLLRIKQQILGDRHSETPKPITKIRLSVSGNVEAYHKGLVGGIRKSGLQ
jgi:hypothetical protein